MNTEYAIPNVNALAARWWVPVVRGVAAILFGILALTIPKLGLLTLIILWGTYALVDGVLNVMQAAWRGRAGRTWGWLLFEGIVSVAAGVAAFVWPDITALALLSLIAVWAMVTGIAEIAAAIVLRRQISGEWLLVTSGVLSFAFGALVLLFPGAGALALVWWIGAYAIAFGALLIGLGVRLNRWRRAGERPSPTGGMPTPA
jgi:uncharacterized membrane protein HdeD (DUF308 family)